MRKLLYTIVDIGCFRIIARIRYEIRKYLENFISPRINLFLISANTKSPKWLEILPELQLSHIGKIPNYNNLNSITLTFLNQKKILQVPINWNNSSYDRLWNFNLHYFEWARLFLDDSLTKGFWHKDINYIQFLIDDWIKTNPPGKGDGWHSYTISLRIRSWIYVFRSIPDILSAERIQSLWQQICWLDAHLEVHHGGNHLLENLIALLIGSMQFDGEKSKKIFNISLIKLKSQLEHQILEDGGHYERSVTYHALLLDRLVELSFLFEAIKKSPPSWLIDKIYNMEIWLKKVRFLNGKFPRFNDSPTDICPSIDYVISFAESLIYNEKYIGNGFRSILCDFCFAKSKKYLCKYEQNKLIDLPNTGWTMIRPTNHIDIAFKCGQPCPKYLPAHTHSDQLSFEVYSNGIPIISEVGTSIYAEGADRSYERSGSAHNILQLGIKSTNKDFINWIEPVDVWSSFRAGRKAKITYRDSGLSSDGKIWTSGAHDAYSRFGATHIRDLSVNSDSEKIINLEIVDKVSCKNKMFWRQWWHLGPNQNQDFIFDIVQQLSRIYELEYKLVPTWHSTSFGEKIYRKSLMISGEINPGYHLFSVKINL